MISTRNALYPTAAIGLLLIAWQAAVEVFAIPTYLLPSPLVVSLHLAKHWDYLLANAWVTTYETLGGFLLSVVLGVPLAMAIVWSPLLDRTATPLLVISQTFPKVAIAPLLIIWLGFGVQSKVIVSFLIAFFPVVVAGVAGMRSVDPELLELIGSMPASSLQIFFKVRLPFAAVHFFAGFKVAVTFAVVGAVVGEWVGADKGLGYLLLTSNANLDTPMLFSILACLMIIGVVFYYTVAFLERVLLPWHADIGANRIQPTM